jgi:hypothetical protein
MQGSHSLRVERRCSGCGRVAVVTFRHRASAGGRNWEVPLCCPYEECGRTMVLRLDAQADPQSISVRQHDGMGPAQA